jgi:hypothetical protein
VIAGPGALADVLGALPVCVERIEVRASAVPAGDYPGGARPSSVLRLSGLGQLGRGENVAFTEGEHQRFGARAATLLASGATTGGTWRGSVAGLIDQGARGYERAALEAALIDLALRQAGTTLAAMTATAERSVRVVRSFAARPDAAAHVRRLRDMGHAEDLKIDVDPEWDAAAMRALAAEAGVAVLDFKGRGDRRLAAALSPLFPGALFEDPPAPCAHQRISRDIPLADAQAAGAALARGEAVNLKAPRMGGPLQVLRALELARRVGSPAAVYMGGMFEVDVGRTQARQLAALFCPDGPNDLAPLQGGGARRIPVRLDTPGFG